MNSAKQWNKGMRAGGAGRTSGRSVKTGEGGGKGRLGEHLIQIELREVYKRIQKNKVGKVDWG